MINLSRPNTKGVPTYDGHFTEGLGNDFKFAMSMVDCKRSGSNEKDLEKLETLIFSRIFR